MCSPFHILADDMEIINLGDSSRTFYKAQDQSMMSGHSSKKKKIKQYIEREDEEEDEDESYEKIITKTKIKIKKGKKSKGRGKGKAYYEEDEESEDDYENMEIPGIYSLYLSNDVNFKIRTPKPAICMCICMNKKININRKLI